MSEPVKTICGRADDEDLADARDYAAAMRDLARGAPLLTSAEVDAYLSAETPLAFWRRRSGLTRGALAETIGVSQDRLALWEQGERIDSDEIKAGLAHSFGVRVEDLEAEPD